MIVTTNGTRAWRRYRLVACSDKLRLPSDVLAALESRTRDHVLTASGFFPCSIDREYLYGYAADGYRSPLWLCAAYNGSPALVHRHRGHKVFFHVVLGGPPFVSPVLRGFCRPKNRHSVLPINQLPFLLMFHPWFPTPMDSLPILLSMGFSLL